MSTCKKFVKDSIDGLTPEERLALLEEKLPILIERIQAYDKVVDENSILNKKLATLQSVVDHLASRSVSLQKDIELHGVSRQNDTHTLFARIEESNRKILSIAQELSSYEESSTSNDQAVSAHFVIVNDEMTQLASELVSKNDFKAFTLPLINDLNAIREQINRMATWKVEDDKNILELQKTVSSQGASLKLLFDMVGGINTDFSQFPKSIKELDDKVTSMLNQRLMNFNDRLNSRLEEVSNRLVPQGASIQDVKELLTAQLNSFKLDISNSILKTSNNTQQLNLVDKKIENIYLLLKKYDLNQ